MVRAGIQEQAAMRISGHRTRAVFDRYNIVSPDDLKQVAKKLGVYHEMVTNTVTTDKLNEYIQNGNKGQLLDSNTELSLRESGGNGKRGGLRIQGL